MATLRPTAVAGMFYPGQPVALRQSISEALAGAATVPTIQPKALIVPHAGYIYSGPVAASAYRLLKPLAASIERVVLIGPSHRVGFYGFALSSADYFATPLGHVPVDRQAVARLSERADTRVFDAAHAQEHCLEVQLPFLQTLLPMFSIVPIVTGEASSDATAEVLASFAEESATLIVISSDLSHYHDYVTAQRLDRETTDHIAALDYKALTAGSACGRVAVCGGLALAKARGWQVTVLDVRNSGDTAGSKDRVVGYGAYALH